MNKRNESELRTWVRFLATHSAITRELEAQLLGAHGLTLSDYDVLVQLARAPEHRLRNIELAKAIVLTRSGVTRLVDGLERDGLVSRCSCPSDKRGTLIELTDEGMTRLREATGTHLNGVRELFLERIGPEGREAMDAMLRELPGGAECESRACMAEVPAAAKASAA
ncbi:MAG: MarR family winged helix-turn-helix transcriptional regulator [Thermoleophilaceae bacterium]